MVYLQANPLTAISLNTYIPQLLARGVTVYYDAPRAVTLLTGVSDPVVVGVPSGVTVIAGDASGNIATGYTGTIHFTSTDSSATLPVNYTFTGSGGGKDNGFHTFANGVTFQTYGEQSVTATDTVTATITGSQTAITVTPVIEIGIPLAAGWNFFSVPFSLENGYSTMGQITNSSPASLSTNYQIGYYYDRTDAVSPYKLLSSTYVLHPCDVVMMKLTGPATVSLFANTTISSQESKRLYRDGTWWD